MSYLALIAVLAISQGNQHVTHMSAKPLRVAVVCFKSGETTSGMNKICYYNCLGSEAAITVGAAELCPLQINR